MQRETIFARPWEVSAFEDTHFYHVMDVPGVGVTTGEWDLRAGFEEYIGRYDFAGKRVLEIGPASGFLTFEMERRGADVVSVEVPDDHLWDYVPYPDKLMAMIYEPRREIMRKLKNSFWFAHKANNSKARVYYGNVYDLPTALGTFDVAVMASVLLHCRDPLQIVAQCAQRARELIIVDMFYPELENASTCRLVPSASNEQWDTWWHFSTDFFQQYLGVLGFANFHTSTHTQYHREHTPYTLFTIVSSRP